jgi:hypothetical protein
MAFVRHLPQGQGSVCELANLARNLCRCEHRSYSRPTCATFKLFTRWERKVHCRNITTTAVTIAVRIDEANRIHEVQDKPKAVGTAA